MVGNLRTKQVIHLAYTIVSCQKKGKPPSQEVKIDFLRDADGVPIVGPDGQPWFVELSTTILPKTA
jgi:hypothetical protein